MAILGVECQKADWSTHKTICKAPSYLLKITLCPGHINDPEITRTLNCPSSATFAQLHLAIQIAFRWASTHSYDFQARDPDTKDDQVDGETAMARYIAIALGNKAVDRGPPKSFVRFTEPGADMSPGFGVDMMHAHQRQHPKTPETEANKVKLGQQFERKELKGANRVYEYDFGDCWNHGIEIIGRGRPNDGWECLVGEGHECVEDVGGAEGWQELKKAYKTKTPTEEEEEKMHWFETHASNADDKGLKHGREYVWDRDAVNFRLRKQFK